MGMVFRRKVKFCTTCNQRLDKSAQQRACRAARHAVEIRELPVWWLKYYENGKPRYESAKTTKQRKAEKLLRDREHAIDEGVPIDPKKGLIRFEEAVELLKTDYTLNNKKLKKAEQRIDNHLKPVFTGSRLATITATEIKRYQEQRRKEGAANGTINRETGLFRRMYRLALKSKKLSHAHLPEFDKLKENNARKGFFEPAQFESMKKHLPAHMKGVATFAHETGWRTPSEVLPLEWRHVDFKAGEVRLDPGTTKNDEPRVFPFTVGLRQLLEAQQKQAKQVQKGMGKIPRYVFFHLVKMQDGSFGKKTGERITESGYNKAWRHARTLAGCPGRIPHDFRRTTVRRLEQAGVSRSVAMKLTGHKTEAIYRRYAIVSAGDLREAVQRLNGYTSGDTGRSNRPAAGQRSQNP